MASSELPGLAPRTDPPENAQAPPTVDINDGVVVDVLSVTRGVEHVTFPPENGRPIVVRPTESASDSEVVKAVVEAARNLATQSHFPGVSEAATLVSILVNLVSDDHACSAEVESRVKRCRLVIMMLQRASLVIGKVR